MKEYNKKRSFDVGEKQSNWTSNGKIISIPGTQVVTGATVLELPRIPHFLSHRLVYGLAGASSNPNFIQVRLQFFYLAQIVLEIPYGRADASGSIPGNTLIESFHAAGAIGNLTGAENMVWLFSNNPALNLVTLPTIIDVTADQVKMVVDAIGPTAPNYLFYCGILSSNSTPS